nr:hypothetical protein [uncultured Oscillibacter sp.]
MAEKDPSRQRPAVVKAGFKDLINACRFAPEIFAGKEENRRNPGGFQDFLTQISGNLRRKDACGD